MKLTISLTIWLLISTSFIAGAADVVLLKNGDRISGDATRMADGYDNNNGANSRRDWLVLNNFDYFITDRSYLSAWLGFRQNYF